MDYSTENIFSRKNLIPLLFLAILILAIPLGLKLVQQTQQLTSKAAGDIKITGEGVSCTGNECTTTSPNFKIELDSPFGPPGQQSQIQ